MKAPVPIGREEGVPTSPPLASSCSMFFCETTIPTGRHGMYFHIAFGSLSVTMTWLLPLVSTDFTEETKSISAEPFFGSTWRLML